MLRGEHRYHCCTQRFCPPQQLQKSAGHRADNAQAFQPLDWKHLASKALFPTLHCCCRCTLDIFHCCWCRGPIAAHPSRWVFSLEFQLDSALPHMMHNDADIKVGAIMLQASLLPQQLQTMCGVLCTLQWHQRCANASSAPLLCPIT